MAAIERVIANSGLHPAGELVPAAALAFRQLREVHPPAHLGGAMCAEIGGSTPNRRDDCGQDGQHDCEKQRKKDDMARAPMESINPRKHFYPLPSLAQTTASSDKTRNKQSRHRRSRRRR